MKKVILNLGTGTLLKGCESAMGEILGAGGLDDGSTYPIRFTGQLAPAPELAATQKRWQQLYVARNQDQALRIHLLDVEGIRYSENDFNQCCLRLVTQLNDWLNTPEFLSVDRALRTELERTDDVQIILETTDMQLRKLPWHLWGLFEDYPRAELTLSALDWRPLPLSASRRTEWQSNWSNWQLNGRSNQSGQSRILATFGNHDGLDLADDLATLSSLENTHLDVLESPTLNQLHENLWQPQGWDIFFFAGHSQTEGETGVINLNAHERLTVEQIKYALEKAIANGLKIAIFNSCDGLGLARQLSDLQIPYVVVMREPVPDSVAQQFLRYLLTAFSEGMPFHLAMREARQRLAGLENEIPCASWLPIIWQNPTAAAIYWPSAEHTQKPLVAPSRGWFSTAQRVAIRSLVTSGIVLAIRALGLLEPVELDAYDRLMAQRPAEPVDARTVVIEVPEETTSQYGYPLPDEPLTALIDRINQAQPLAIGLDLHRARPQPSRTQSTLVSEGAASATASEISGATSGYETFLAQVETTPTLFLVCFYSSTDENYGTPPQLSEEIRTYQVGFSDIPIDRFSQFSGNPRGDVTLQGSHARMGETVRRQWLSYDPTLSPDSKNCETPYSLSFQLAYEYLDRQGVGPLDVTADEHWRFGDVVFESLPQRMGAYQRLAAHSGQIMLNYRTNQPGEKVTFDQLMSPSFDLQMLTDKIVLIGYTAPVSKDYFETPYGPMAGLWVHAHMVSQMISAVQDGRSLLHGLPQWGSWQWGDWLWVLAWGIGGGTAGWYVTGLVRWWVSLVAGGLVLYGLCWLSLVSGLWLPLVPSALAAAGASTWVRRVRHTASGTLLPSSSSKVVSIKRRD